MASTFRHPEEYVVDTTLAVERRDQMERRQRQRRGLLAEMRQRIPGWSAVELYAVMDLLREQLRIQSAPASPAVTSTASAQIDRSEPTGAVPARGCPPWDAA